MARRRFSISPQTQHDIPPIVRLWILRLLVRLGGHQEFISHHGFRNNDLADHLGLGKWIDPEHFEFDQKAVRLELRKLYEAEERKAHSMPIPSCLYGNVDRLSALIKLSEYERHILAFAVMIRNESLLDDAADILGPLSSVKMFHVLSLLLDIPEEEIRKSLSAQGMLARSGLVSVDRSGVSTLRGKLDILSDSFADNIFSSESDPISLLRDMVVPGAAAQLDLTDYEYIASSLAVLRSYLKQSIATGRKGVNIFLYGSPGTGKSQLVKALAEELGFEHFEVSSEDREGDPVSGERRLRAFRAAQSFFSQRNALILFDEVEDVFNDGDSVWGRKSTAQLRKAWINRILEDNSVPTLWLSNSVQSLDPAFIRRFDMLLELPIPPKRKRERILHGACSDLLNDETISRLAEMESLAPALVTRAASVVRSIRDDIGANNAAEAFEMLIGNTLEAQGHRPIRKNDANRLPDIYDSTFIHADSDLAALAAGIAQSKSARLCLYGPSGTGKTAYGRWLAEQMGTPLMVKRASDLMSMWVGENERNIASAFKQAEADGALLLIDEVDSFLQDRRGAQRSWEVSLVNEMLTQMESFSGVFIASTNLMNGLDQAALRRFDLKVKFDFLKPEQAWNLLFRCCQKLAIPEPEPELWSKLMRMQKLTPGDFATIMRQNRFRPITSSVEFVTVLEAECAAKEGAISTIGFLH